MQTNNAFRANCAKLLGCVIAFLLLYTCGFPDLNVHLCIPSSGQFLFIALDANHSARDALCTES